MKRRIRLTEGDLRRIVKKSVSRVLSEVRKRRVIKEVRGGNLEKEDVTWVNGREDGGKPWMVRLWTGSGYFLPAFGAYADGEEEAICFVVAWIEQNEGENSKFFVDNIVERERSEMEEKGMDEEEIENEIESFAIYIDATLEGANEPHYIWRDNAKVYPYDEKRFR